MEMKKLPITELRAFLLAVSQHGNQHLAEVEADLQQTSFLLNEAIEKLGASFMAMNALIEQEQAALANIQQLNDLPQASLDKVNHYQTKIGEEINTVVTGMQFQDMTNQLLQRTINRINGLKDLLQMLATHGHSMSAEEEHQDIVNFLALAQASLDEGSQALSGGLRKSVGQQNMDTGDIELF